MPHLKPEDSLGGLNEFLRTYDGICGDSIVTRFDGGKSSRYLDGTSLLFVSTAERGATSSAAALAFFIGLDEKKAFASKSPKNAQFPSPITYANGTFHKPPNWA